MNTSTYLFTNNNLSALLKDLSSEEEHQILGGTKISHKPVCKSKKSKLQIERIKEIERIKILLASRNIINPEQSGMPAAGVAIPVIL